MKDKISIVIPNFNRSREVLELIHSISKSTYKNYDITIVDDCSSTDNSFVGLKAKGVNVVRHDKRRGPAAARNTGAKNTEGSILLFIDSDVNIYPNTLEKIVSVFARHPEYSCLVPIPGKNNKYNGICSMHFVLRVHYNYLHLPDFIHHTCGTATAVRRKVFEAIGGYNEKLKRAGIEDAEFGLEMFQRNMKIYVAKENPVIHNKKIELLELLRNDFNRTIERIFYMLRKKQLRKIFPEKRFISTPPSQIISAFIAPLVFISFCFSFFNVWFLFPLIFALFLFGMINSSYLKFVAREKGIFVSIALYFLIILDMFFVHFALWWGLIRWLKGDRY